MNGYNMNNMDTYGHPVGWNDSSFLIDPWVYTYYHSRYTNKVNALNNKTDVTEYPNEHTTDVTHQKALAMMAEAAASPNPFFMMVAPVAPHSQLRAGSALPPLPAKYKNTFDDRKVPRTENFNPDEPSGGSWIHNLPKQKQSEVEFGDKLYYHRLGNLAYVDDMVADLISHLDGYGLLDNTYIIYTTDNGFHIGNHRLNAGKRCPYEEDINIPMLIRGPDVAKGE